MNSTVEINNETVNIDFFKSAFVKSLISKVEFLGNLITGEIEIKKYDDFTQIHITDLVFAGCVSLIDALGNTISKGTSKQGFIEVLCKYGGDPLWGAVEPGALLEYLQEAGFFKESNPRFKESNPRFKDPKKVKEFLTTLQSEKRLFEQDEIRSLLKQDNLHERLCQADKAKIKNNMYHGTFAAIVYNHIRNRVVHDFGANYFAIGDFKFKDNLWSHIMRENILSYLKSISDEKWVWGKEILRSDSSHPNIKFLHTLFLLSSLANIINQKEVRGNINELWNIRPSEATAEG